MRNKYRAVKKTVDGYRFDSKGEAGLYLELLARQRIGEILKISVHHPMPLYGPGKHMDTAVICKHEVDFYCEMADGTDEAHEFKGVETALWRMKKKLFEANYPDVPYIVHRKE